MTPEEFTIKNKLNTSDQAVRVIDIGVEIMRKSIDPLHNEKHIFRILKDLDSMLSAGEFIGKESLNFEILLLSIVWHDAWRTLRFQDSVYQIIKNGFWEGIGSERMFANVANVVGLDKELIKKTKYAIRKHSYFQFLPIKTLEAKILHDLDCLEGWSLERVEPLKQRYLILGSIDVKWLRIASFYFYRFMFREKESKYYFEWSKKEFLKRKEAYIKEINKFLAEFSIDL